MQSLKFLIIIMLTVGCMATPINVKVSTQPAARQRSLSAEEVAFVIGMQQLDKAKSMDTVKLLKKHIRQRKRRRFFFWKGLGW